MEYEDFSIKIEPIREGSYPVIVLDSPAGKGRSSFTLPFELEKLGSLLRGLGLAVRGPANARDLIGTPAGLSPQEIGAKLFEALFNGPVLSMLDKSLGSTQATTRGLRIKIHIDPEDQTLAPLTSLPWELLYRKETREFLNLSRNTPILRDLDVQSPCQPLQLKLPLRILVVSSDPLDYLRLDLQRERTLIGKSLAQVKGLQVEILSHPSMLALQERLSEQVFHVLHYMGHGGFDEVSGCGVLLLENEAGNGVPVDGATLGVLLHDVPSLRLVVLNACETARLPKEHGLDPFAGVASSLLMAGIPSVVAMQFPISDRAALTFSQRFYSLLSQGQPIDTAMAEGRRAIRIDLPNSLEWATPVLFNSAPQGVLFRLTSQPGKEEMSEAVKLVEEKKETQPLEVPTTKKLKQVPLHLPTESPPALPSSRTSFRKMPSARWLIWGIPLTAMLIVGIVLGSRYLFPKSFTPTQTKVETSTIAQKFLPSASRTFTPSPSATIKQNVTPSVANTFTPSSSATIRQNATPSVTNIITPSPSTTNKSTSDPSIPPPCTAIRQTWTSPRDGMTLMCVPAGAFSMGSENGNDGEKPVHIVTLGAYWIDQTEVTNARFAQFIEETGYQTLAEKEGWGLVWTPSTVEQVNGADWKHPQGPQSSISGMEQHPVVQVSWDDAVAYCQWAGHRLPTEAEWEKAARGTDGWTYPWGESKPAGNRLNFADKNLQVDWANKSIDDGYQLTAPVGNYPDGASPYGVLDMAGNVSEWVADWYADSYYGSQTEGYNPLGPNLGEYRVLRGGSWLNNGWVVRTSVRTRDYPSNRYDLFGFRCSRSP